MPLIRNRRMCFQTNSSNHLVYRYIPASGLESVLASVLESVLESVLASGLESVLASVLESELESVPLPQHS